MIRVFDQKFDESIIFLAFEFESDSEIFDSKQNENENGTNQTNLTKRRVKTLTRGQAPRARPRHRLFRFVLLSFGFDRSRTAPIRSI